MEYGVIDIGSNTIRLSIFKNLTGYFSFFQTLSLVYKILVYMSTIFEILSIKKERP